MATFTKNNRTGKFDVIGTVDEMHEGQMVVTKKSGDTTTVFVSRLTRPFVSKFGPLKGKQCQIGTVGGSKYSARECESMGDRYAGTSLEGQYCGYPCPVSGKKCCPKNGPCHDCM